MIPLTVRRGLFLLPLAALAGCNAVVLNPSGDIAAQQAHLVVVSTLLMLLIVVPVIALIALFAWRYRKANTTAKYEPDWDHSTRLELVIWGVPLILIIVLGLITWITTHRLDPYRPIDRLDARHPIAASTRPLIVEVVAMDWKWMFIYPEQGIATVNELVVPTNVPVRFKITASTVMNAFYVPTLAGMIYAMPGMETEMNAVQNTPVVSEGFSSNYSGAGFSDMRFPYKGVAQADFDKWVQSVKAGGGELSRAAYVALDKPSIKEPIHRFGTVEPMLYNLALNRCVAEGSVCINKMMSDDARRARADVAMKQVPTAGATQVAQLCTTPTNSSKK